MHALLAHPLGLHSVVCVRMWSTGSFNRIAPISFQKLLKMMLPEERLILTRPWQILHMQWLF